MYVFVRPVVDMKISVGGSSCEIKEGQGQIKHTHKSTVTLDTYLHGKSLFPQLLHFTPVCSMSCLYTLQ